MKISVVIPTRGDQNMENILTCLQAQTFEDFEVIFVVDKTIADYELRITNSGLKNIDTRFHVITNLNSSLRPNNNASVLRNY
jgi:glycosyltransferase involved in cell wall biosynthesis